MAHDEPIPELPDPEYSAEQAAELARIDDLIAELKGLEARGLVTPEALATVEAEKAGRRRALEQSGRASHALRLARKLMGQDQARSIAWAELACRLDPNRLECWRSTIDMARSLGDFARALEICREAVEQRGHESLQGLQGTIADEIARQDRVRSIQAWLDEARTAFGAGQYDGAIRAARRALVDDPELVQAVEILAEAYERSGRIEEAIDALETWRRRRPSQFPTRFAAQLSALRQRLAPVVSPGVALLEPIGFKPPVPAGPGLRAVAAEFLQDHWQKLLLGLAVALIVVSSTVGAAVVLGDRLWRPEGKCLLALAYTGLFAAFGRGLIRWGADRAGRIMGLTTLLVLPLNFSLLGEMPSRESASGLAVLAFGVSALSLMAGWLGRALRLPGGLPAISGMLAIGLIDAVTPRPSAFAWGYPAILLASAVFLAAVEWLHRGRERWHLPLEGLGLLAFAFVWAVARIGGTVVSLPPSLYAIPAMLAGIGAVRVVSGLRGRTESAVRFAGLAMAGLAFAIALARPPGPSALFSGNTLATAVLGLALFARCLTRERHPAYLYAAFGALFLAYFGAYDFLRDLIRSVEGAAAHVLGYRDRLPFAYKALNGLVFNAALLALSRWFEHRWRDRRLARHCHFIGLPLAAMACILGATEPTAALLTFSGYAIGFAFAAWLLSVPWVVYLACSAFAGAALAAFHLLGDPTGGWRSLAMASVSMAYWLACRLLDWRGAGEAYRRPIVMAARVVSALAVALAFGALAWSLSVSWTVVSAFAVLALLYALLHEESPSPSMAYASLACGAMSALLAAKVGSDWAGRPMGLAGFAAWASMVGASLTLASRSGRPASYARPALVTGLILLAGATSLAIFRVADAPVSSAEWLLVASTLAILSASQCELAWRRPAEIAWPYLSGMACWMAALSACTAWAGPIPDSFGWLSLTTTFVMIGWLVLRILLAGRERSRAWPDPLRVMELVVAPSSIMLAIAARIDSASAFPIALASLALLVPALVVSACRERCPGRASLAIFTGVLASAMLVIGYGPELPTIRSFGVLATGLSMVCWALERLVATRLDSRWRPVFGVPLLASAVLLAAFAPACEWASPGALLFAALPFVLIVVSTGRAEWLYVAMGLIAASLIFHDRGEGRLLASLVMLAYGYVLIGAAIRLVGPFLDRIATRDQLVRPWFDSALLLGLLALGIQSSRVFQGLNSWYASAWLPFAVGALMLAMRWARPSRGWIHGWIGLWTLGLLLASGPRLGDPVDPLGLVLVGSLAALIWRLASWLASRWAFLPIVEGDRLEGEFEAWSIGLAVASAMPLAYWTFEAVGRTCWDLAVTWPSVRSWVCGLLALVILQGLLEFAQGFEIRRQRTALGLLAGTLLLWWLALPGSPLTLRLGADSALALPMLTAIQAGWRSAWGSRLRRWGESGAELLGWSAALGAIVAILLTGGSIGWPTSITLAIATAVLAHRAIEDQSPGLSGLASLSAMLACGAISLQTARALGYGLYPGSAAALAIGEFVAATTFVLLGERVSGSIRRVLEGFAQLACGFVVMLVVSTFLAWNFPRELAWIDLLLLAGVGALLSILAQRRHSIGLASLAHASALLGYLAFRRGFPEPGLGDSSVLLVLATIELGLAEILSRFQRPIFARTAFGASMILPVFAVILATLDGLAGDRAMFAACASATLYAIACGRTGWRPFGQVAAVLFNAFVWIFWYRAGWSFAENPQCYAIPVGLSAFLFAEAYRGELGRKAVAAVRGLGLALIYVSLAVPIWKDASVGAWALLLAASMLGIFAGIGLRSQVFLWMGLAGFVLDVGYQVGRVGLDHALARWGIMLALGMALLLFVALSEKQGWLARMKGYLDEVRSWD